jgi:hypothetical protein
MTTALRIFFYGLIGVIAGLLCWPFTEVVLIYQADFPSLLLFSVVLGIVIGLFMGGSFGTSEGIVTNSGAKIRTGALAGVSIGAAGGVIGFISGQAALLYIGTFFFNTTGNVRHFGIPISRALGWAVMGAFIGLAEGIRSGSGSKSRNGVVGGFIGGLFGGFAVEYLHILSPQSHISRLIGLVILGGFIGLFYGLVEKGFTPASLRILNGLFRGREFLLSQKKTTLGESRNTEITLSGYRNVAPEHVEILRERKNYTVCQVPGGKPLYVNDQKVEKTVLHDGDVIRAGDAQFQFIKK